MRLVVTQNITLDGVIELNERTGHWFGAASGGADTADLEEALRQMMRAEDAQLYGRQTFEAMRRFWPEQTDDTTGVAQHLDVIPKYVISTTMDDPEWENSTVLHGDLLDEARALKDRGGSNLGLTGSISVCSSLVSAHLVDEYRLFVHPVVVGTGRRLFEDDARVDLELVESRPFSSGVVLLTYLAT